MQIIFFKCAVSFHVELKKNQKNPPVKIQGQLQGRQKNAKHTVAYEYTIWDI